MFPPALPPAPSWYPGHMSRFTRLLPAFLTRTDIVIELRDSRLPLTSINPAFETAIAGWQSERRKMGSGTAESSVLCERIVVLGKKDLVGQWGIEPFRNAMRNYFPDQHVHFTSYRQQRTIKDLSNLLVSIASRNTEATPEVNVLVVGMPNVGKSTLLNALRSNGIPGPTPKALRTSAHPGLTRALSTRLKLSVNPLIYAFDSPGVMIPFLGRGDRGSERGVKLALIAGIKEGMYDIEGLAAYLLYRLWVLSPRHPSYMSLLPPSSPQPSDIYEFLEMLAIRLGAIRRGGERDLRRAAVWFIKWWRDEGGLISASASPTGKDDVATSGPILERAGWGFDFEWDFMPRSDSAGVQAKMEAKIQDHLRELEEEKAAKDDISLTQERKREREEKISRRRNRRNT